MTRRLLGLLALGLLAHPASAVQRASDVVYVPAAAHVQGFDFFQTDLVVHNLHDAPARITMMFLPSSDGSVDNRGADLVTADFSLAPDATRAWSDVLGSLFGVEAGSGALIVFACETTEDCQTLGPDGLPIGAAPVLVTSRTYALADDGKTSGQAIPGVPVDAVADGDDSTSSRGRLILAGLLDSPPGAPGATFRANVGLVNASSSWTTTLELTVLAEDGSVEATLTKTLAPLAHLQINRFFEGLGLDDGARHSIRVEATDNVLASGLDPADATAAAFLAYASLIDDGSGDPTYLEGAFASGPTNGSRARPRRSQRPIRH